MTIIAYRDGMLAADSLEISGDVRVTMVRKLFRVTDGIIGCSGSRPAIDKVVAHLRGTGLSPRDLGEDDFRALLIDGNGAPMEMNHHLERWPVGSFAAVGGAWRLGMGALGFGASATEAVKVAIDLCVNCGGPIQWMRLTDQGEV